jgi:hypothetical protein
MARAGYPSELIYAALNGLRSGWCAHAPDASRSPQPAPDLLPSATSQKSARRPRRGGRPSQERRSARRFEARAKQLAAEEAARNKVAAEKEAAHRKAQAAAEKEAAQKKVVAEKAAPKKKEEAEEHERSQQKMRVAIAMRGLVEAYNEQARVTTESMQKLVAGLSQRSTASKDEPPRRRK